MRKRGVFRGEGYGGNGFIEAYVVSSIYYERSLCEEKLFLDLSIRESIP